MSCYLVNLGIILEHNAVESVQGDLNHIIDVRPTRKHFGSPGGLCALLCPGFRNLELCQDMNLAGCGDGIEPELHHFIAGDCCQALFIVFGFCWGVCSALPGKPGAALANRLTDHPDINSHGNGANQSFLSWKPNDPRKGLLPGTELVPGLFLVFPGLGGEYRSIH